MKWFLTWHPFLWYIRNFCVRDPKRDMSARWRFRTLEVSTAPRPSLYLNVCYLSEKCNLSESIITFLQILVFFRWYRIWMACSKWLGVFRKLLSLLFCLDVVWYKFYWNNYWKSTSENFKRTYSLWRRYIYSFPTTRMWIFFGFIVSTILWRKLDT